MRCIKRAEKSGLHGLNYDVRDEIKEPYYSKSITGRHLTSFPRDFVNVIYRNSLYRYRDRLLRAGDKATVIVLLFANVAVTRWLRLYWQKAPVEYAGDLLFCGWRVPVRWNRWLKRCWWLRIAFGSLTAPTGHLFLPLAAATGALTGQHTAVAAGAHRRRSRQPSPARKPALAVAPASVHYLQHAAPAWSAREEAAAAHRRRWYRHFSTWALLTGSTSPCGCAGAEECASSPFRRLNQGAGQSVVCFATVVQAIPAGERTIRRHDNGVNPYFSIIRVFR